MGYSEPFILKVVSQPITHRRRDRLANVGAFIYIYFFEWRLRKKYADLLHQAEKKMWHPLWCARLIPNMPPTNALAAVHFSVFSKNWGTDADFYAALCHAISENH